MKILVTGASGFIGHWVVKGLMNEHELYCPLRGSGGPPVHKQVHPLEVDLSGDINLEHLPLQIDAIIHLAQSRNFRKFPDQAQDIFRVNTHSTQQLLEYGRRSKARVFIYASSGGVCGYQPQPITEEDPPQIMNYYLATKYASECLVRSYREQFAAVILRYFFVYGEGQRNMFMPGLVERIQKGNPVALSGKTGMIMNPIYVSDAVNATIRALVAPRSEIFNVAGGETTNILDLANLIGKLVGKAPQFQIEPTHTSMAMVANIEKTKLKLDMVPKVSLEEGLGRLVNDMGFAQGKRVV